MKMYFQSKYITDRSQYDRNAPEGGALNGNYQDVEAAIYISNRLGESGYSYNKDFYFINCGIGAVVLEFYNRECATAAALMFGDAVTASKGFEESSYE
jgi:hypothetical protein